MTVKIFADRGGCSMYCDICDAMEDCESLPTKDRLAWIAKHERKCRKKQIKSEVERLMDEYRRLK